MNEGAETDGEQHHRQQRLKVEERGLEDERERRKRTKNEKGV